MVKMSKVKVNRPDKSPTQNAQQLMSGWSYITMKYCISRTYAARES